MTLSPSQRLEAYEWCYELVETYNIDYIHGTLRDWVNSHKIQGDGGVFKMFPETKLFIGTGARCFPYTREHRLTVLAFCIAMIETDLDSDDYETAFINSLKD